MKSIKHYKLRKHVKIVKYVPTDQELIDTHLDEPYKFKEYEDIPNNNLYGNINDNLYNNIDTVSENDLYDSEVDLYGKNNTNEDKDSKKKLEELVDFINNNINNE